MAKAIKTVAGIALTAVGVVTGIAPLAAIGMQLTVSSLQKQPKTPAAQTDRLSASVDPRAFRKTALGPTAFPIDVRYEEWTGSKQDRCSWMVAHGDRCESLDAVWLNDELAWTAAGGTQGKFRNYFWVRGFVAEGSPTNTRTVTDSTGRWNQSHRLTGVCYSHLEFRTTGTDKKAESPFASGIPSRITMIGKGARLYDPRRDSTVPGGSGPMRIDDQSTWRYTADDGAVIGDNLALQILRVAIGWRIRNPTTGVMKLATGMGLPRKRLDLESFITAANLCDETVTTAAGVTEKRYRGAGVVSEGEDPREAQDRLCASCNGRITERGGKLGLAIAHNDLAAAATDDGLNDDDVIGGFRWSPDPALDAAPNIVRGKFTDPSNNALFQLVDYPELKIPSVDGQDRILNMDLSHIQYASQAQRIGAQVLMRRQYQRTFTAPFDIRAWKYRQGDVVPFTFAPLGFNRKLFRVVDQVIGQGGACEMLLRVEDPAIYPLPGQDRPAVQAAEPNVYDTRNNPLVQGIEDAGKTADWSGIVDDNGNKPEDGATKGAPAGTEVHGRPVEQVLADLDQNALSILAEQMTAGTWRTEIDRVVYDNDGKAVREHLQQIGARGEAHDVWITDMRRVDPNTGYAKALMSLTVDNKFVGFVSTNDGKVGAIDFVYDAARFLRPDGTVMWGYDSTRNVIVAPALEVDTIKAKTVDTPAIADYAIRRHYGAELAANVDLPGTNGQRQRFLAVVVNKQLGDSALRVETTMRPRPGRDYSCTFVIGRTSGGVEVTLDTVQYWVTASVINGVRSVRIPFSYSRSFLGLPAGEHTLWVDVIAFGGGNDQGFMEAGSNFDIEEVKR